MNVKNELMTDETFGKIETKYLAIADKVTFEKEMSFAVQLLSKNSYLNKSTTISKLLAVYNTALTGLSLNPVLKQAYLIPRWNNDISKVECHLEPSYQGLAKLVTDTGSCKNIYAYPVYKGDTFEVLLGTSPEITHTPKYESKELDKMYAVAVLHDGSKQIEVMTISEIHEIRARSESYKAFKDPKNPAVRSCVWVTDEVEMGRKTLIRRIVKYLPKTELWDKLGEAIALDNVDYGLSHGQYGMIESLLISAKITNDESRSIYQELNTMSSDRATECIQYLKDRQPDFQDGDCSNAAINDELTRKMDNEKD